MKFEININEACDALANYICDKYNLKITEADNVYFNWKIIDGEFKAVSIEFKGTR